MDDEIYTFLMMHLNSILENDIETYHQTTADDLTLYEWWVTPHRIDGLPFHDFMMEENARRGSVFGSEVSTQRQEYATRTRFDIANLKIQRYSDVAIASYTLLVSTSTPDGVTVASHNESRVIVKFNNQWKVVHVHKSPAYAAPHTG